MFFLNKVERLQNPSLSLDKQHLETIYISTNYEYVNLTGTNSRLKHHTRLSGSNFLFNSYTFLIEKLILHSCKNRIKIQSLLIKITIIWLILSNPRIAI